MVKVLYIEDSGEIIGGGQISLLTLIKGLNLSKFEPVIFCPSEGNFVDLLRESDFETYVFPPKPGAILRFYKFIKKRQVDLIHCNAGASKPSFYGAIAAKLASIPFIWHVRVLEDGGWREWIIGNLSTKIIAISKAVAEKFCWLNSNKVTIVWNSVELSRFNLDISGDKIRDEFDISPDCFLVGIIGRLSCKKGINYFIKACKLVEDKNKNARFLIVGQESSEEKGYKAKLILLIQKLGLTDKVIFSGFREDIPEIISALDVLVLTSISEGFGRVVIEAMAMAKPVVATNAGGIPDIVIDGETGILVPVKDPEAIANAVIEILSNTQKAELMGRQGRKRVEQFFTVEAHVEEIQKLYINLI